jgi:acetolactate synthase-1/2/3 large subunit
MTALAERTGALLGTSLLAKSLFRGHPLDIGVVGGFATETARRLLAAVDCLVAFGASLNVFTRAHGSLFDGARIVQVDVDPAQIGRFGRVDVGVVGDARATATELLRQLEPLPAGARFNSSAMRAQIAIGSSSRPRTRARPSTSTRQSSPSPSTTCCRTTGSC